MRTTTMSRTFALVAVLAFAGACANDPTGISDPSIPTNPGAMSLTPATSTIQPGQLLVLRVGLVDDFGHIVREPVIKWMSSNPAVATVSGGGVVRAVAEGGATITADIGGKTRVATVNVLRLAAQPEIRPLRPNLEPWRRNR
jgi:uncharacterized protein YjdB